MAACTCTTDVCFVPRGSKGYEPTGTEIDASANWTTSAVNGTVVTGAGAGAGAGAIGTRRQVTDVTG